MASQEPTPELRDIWKLLWHIDVKKDHKTDYDSAIVNTLLPISKYESSLAPYNGLPASVKQGNEATLPSPEAEFSKDWIMNYVLRREDGQPFYDSVFTNPEYTDSNTPVLITSYPLGQRYQVVTVNIDDRGAYIKTIGDFFQGQGERMFLNYDTGAYIEDVLKDDSMVNVFDGYTRASQSDPAGKPSKDKLGDKVYLENPQPLAITYPAYAPGSTPFPLSHFYCKYVVNLIQHEDPTLFNQGRLNVSMTYIKPSGEVVYVVEGANTAGAARKQKLLQKKGFQFTKVKNNKTNEKEMIFISKLHGDVAQGLDQHRIISYERGQTSQGARFCFVSIDQNALTKYFTTGGTYAMFYKLEDPKKIALIRPYNEDPAKEFEYLKQRALEYMTKIYNDVTVYNLRIEDLNRRREILPTIVKDLFTEVHTGTASQKYAKIIQKGARIAATLPFVPKRNLVEIDTSQFESLLEELQAYTLGDKELGSVKEEFNRMRAVFAEAERSFQFPLGHIFTDPFTVVEGVQTLKPSTLETDLLVKISNGAVTAKTVDQLWKSINVEFKGRSLRAFFCRIGSKLVTHWCLDVLRQTHRLLEEYDPQMAAAYLFALEAQLDATPALLDTWKEALAIVGLERVTVRPLVYSGGGPNKNRRNTAKRNNKNTNNRNKKNSNYRNNTLKLKRIPTMENQESVFINSPFSTNTFVEDPIEEDDTLLDMLEEELRDMDAVIDFYTAMLSTKEEDVEAIHLDFFNRIYDDLTGGTVGGGTLYEPLQEAEEIDILEEYVSEEGSETKEVEFFMTVPVILSYEQNLKSIESLVEKLQSLRSNPRREERIQEISDALTYIQEKIDMYYKKYSEEDPEVSGGGKKQGSSKKLRQKRKYSNPHSFKSKKTARGRSLKKVKRGNV